MPNLRPRFFILAFVTLLPLAAGASELNEQISKHDDLAHELNHQLLTQIESHGERQKEIARLLAPIKSTEDLGQYLKTYPNYNEPFSALSETGRQLFIDSLTFTEKGLASFNYVVLERELTPSEIYAVLRLFGLAYITESLEGSRVETALDALIMERGPSAKTGHSDSFRDGYYCSSPGTCSVSSTKLCTSNC